MPTVSAPRALRRIRSRAFAIEAALLRASVDALADRRYECRHCHRTPLTGERVHVYAARGGDEVVCELCRPRRADEPARSELVRSPEQAASVTAVAHR
jgi:hypothetical protein